MNNVQLCHPSLAPLRSKWEVVSSQGQNLWSWISLFSTILEQLSPGTASHSLTPAIMFTLQDHSLFKLWISLLTSCSAIVLWLSHLCTYVASVPLLSCCFNDYTVFSVVKFVHPILTFTPACTDACTYAWGRAHTQTRALYKSCLLSSVYIHRVEPDAHSHMTHSTGTHTQACMTHTTHAQVWNSRTTHVHAHGRAVLSFLPVHVHFSIHGFLLSHLRLQL